MRALAFLVASFVALVIAAPLSHSADPVSIPSTWSKRERAAAARVTAPGIAGHVRYLADDLLEGRGAGTRGSELAMKYAASVMERIGLEPAGPHPNDGYLQRFELVGMKAAPSQPPKLTGKNGTLTLEIPRDAIVAAGAQTPSAKLDGVEVIFCGYGITAPEQKWDDFKDADVRGKVILIMNNDPESDPSLFEGKKRLYYGRWTYKYEEAARRGAAGAIIIHTDHSAGYPWQVVRTSWSREEFELPSPPGEPRTQVRMWTTEDASKALVKLGGFDLDELRARAESRDFRPVPLGVKLSVALKTQVRKLETANVLGVLRGSDPKLKDQYEVWSAHHDHLGIGAPAKDGDTIYNGALDNASGVAALLTAAEAIASVEPRPRRSILFAIVGVEESGLLGSQYFVEHPIVPLGRIAADLNLDGINIWGRARDVELTGMGKTNLDAVVIAAAKQQGRVVKPDQFPDRGHFYRSDQFSFARAGVPSIYLGHGLDFVGREPGWGKERVEEYVKTRYHQPGDQMDSTWNLDGAVDDVRLLVTVGLRIAEAPEMPRWTPGDEFEAARKKTLEEPKEMRK